MNTATKEKLLKIVLLLTGITSIFMLPLAAVWPAGWQWHGGEGQYYFQMIAGIYATLGVYMIYVAKNPSDPKHRTFLWFAIFVNIVHGVIMLFQAVGDEMEHGHLVGDVPALIITSLIIWYLMPPKNVN